ncbi:MAG: DUF1643 domain-containing protein [Terracidiphilus sp.]|jgi:hypothetical protein
MKRYAEFSEDRKRRFELIRDWGDEIPNTNQKTVNFIMLNPSVAGETKDDRTVIKCVGFARGWGFTRAVITNLIPIVSTDPTKLPQWDGIDLDNKAFLFRWIKRADLVVAAWGSQPPLVAKAIGLSEHIRFVQSLASTKFRCIGVTKGGSPLHPSRAKYTESPVQWK